jgi:hypothetical protein
MIEEKNVIHEGSQMGTAPGLRRGISEGGATSAMLDVRNDLLEDRTIMVPCPIVDLEKNDAHRTESLKRLGTSARIGEDGCEEFQIDVPVDDEQAGNEDDYKTVTQWLRVPKEFLGGSK